MSRENPGGREHSASRDRQSRDATRQSGEGTKQSREATRQSRETTKAETREALVAAGLAEFAEKGLDAPSLDAICARAGFTRGAFYVHFRDRDEFLECVMEKVFGSFLDAVIATGDNAHDLEETVARFAAAVSYGKKLDSRPVALSIDLHRVLDACARSPLLRNRFVALLGGATERLAAAVARGQQAGAVRNDIAAGVLAQLLAMLALGVITAIDTGATMDFERMRDAALHLLSNKLSSQVGERAADHADKGQ
jgi:TetR/AcrR family transcriptional regulator, transcriptional repressor for nem operon